jgi:hypothetical protein
MTEREDDMTSNRRIVRALAASSLCAAAALLSPTTAHGQGTVRQQSASSWSGTVASIAEQLGAKLTPSHAERFDVGTNFTATLSDTAKIAKLGLRGLHPGARVTAIRTAGDRMRVEVDEMDPEPLTRKATLKIDERGQLSAP